MSPVATLRSGTGILHLPLELPLHFGGTLTSAQLGYELVGQPDAPVVVVLGGISAGRHVTATAEHPAVGWWDAIVGPGRAIDTLRYRVLGLDWLGGSGASTGPRPREAFPLLASQDQALALHHLLDELAVPCIERIVGASFGGMVALAFAERFASRVRALTVISAAHESHPLASGWRSIQRRIVELGLESGPQSARRALALARGLAMTTYRSAEELAERFSGEPETDGVTGRFPIDAWLEARGEDFAAHFSPESFLALNWALDLHRVRPESIQTNVTLVAAHSDQLVPREQVRSLRDRLGGPRRLVEIVTKYGHDAVLKEVVAIADILREDLAEVAP